MTGLARELVPEWPTGKVAQALFELQGEDKEQAEKLVATEAKIKRDLAARTAWVPKAQANRFLRDGPPPSARGFSRCGPISSHFVHRQLGPR